MSLSQNIYTPEDIESSDLIKDDRPYAGILYYAIGFHSKTGYIQLRFFLSRGRFGTEVTFSDIPF